jgi:hypothetical protein
MERFFIIGRIDFIHIPRSSLQGDGRRSRIAVNQGVGIQQNNKGRCDHAPLFCSGVNRRILTFKNYNLCCIPIYEWKKTYTEKYKKYLLRNGHPESSCDHEDTLEIVTSRRITDTPRSPSSNTMGTHFA